MQLTFNNKSHLCNKFLAPISRISDMAILTIEDGKIYSINKTADNNIVLLARCGDVAAGDAARVNLNIPDVKKFIKAFDVITDENISVTLNSNNVEYRSPQIKFKFHLLEDGIIAPAGLNLQKIEKFEYDVHFRVSTAQLSSVLRSSTFITESNKIYFYTEDGRVCCELTDKSRHNLDSFTNQLADRYNGNEIIKPMPFAFDVVRSISTLKATEVDFHINTSRGILCVDVEDGDYQLKYISTAMVA